MVLQWGLMDVCLNALIFCYALLKSVPRVFAQGAAHLSHGQQALIIPLALTRALVAGRAWQSVGLVGAGLVLGTTVT